MALARIIVAVLGLVLFMGVVSAKPRPDSAGIAEMVPGLAYGGIPYGTVSGNLANYYVPPIRQAYYPIAGAPLALVNPNGY